MAQLFTVWYKDTGLSVNITIIDLSDNSVVVNAEAMTEVGYGFYKYTYGAADNTKDYAGRADAGSSRYAPCTSNVVGIVKDIKDTVDSLNDISAQDVWDLASDLTLDFGTLMERLYQLLNNEMNITDADGSVALRNLADDDDIATGSITDNGITTSRAAYSWV